ncbi:MAG: helicase-related protein [Thermodesulfobacteriota bacterium]|nr:helicase-related protein [Thermodesulfobacteriota bacterium]
MGDGETIQTCEEGDWVFSLPHQSYGKIIEKSSLWGKVSYRIWLPSQDCIARLETDQISSNLSLTNHHLRYIAAAARVADALTQDVLLAPIEASVIPLPHQIKALSRAISNNRIRFLLADEVGLGKTIEAGLIMHELKLRGLVNRTLVIAPKGLVTQWVAEMQLHFNEEFQLVLPDDLEILRRLSHVIRKDSKETLTQSSSLSSQSSSLTTHDSTPPSNPWRIFPQVIAPMDSFKPLDKRRGWTPEDVAEYNRERFEDLISAGWDLVIVDEAHRLAGSTEQVARYRLGQGLSEAAPYLLLLSATPHQGKTDAFHRLVSLIDSEEFPDIESVTRDRVSRHVIRTEKRQAIDAEGKPLFKPRLTQLVPISWEDRPTCADAPAGRHREQRLLYEAVTEYVRRGYNQAVLEKRSYIGFLMILMQRLVVSSTRAIWMSLERRLEALETPEEQLTLFPMFSEEEWADLDGQEQVETLLKTRFKAIKNEREEVKALLEAAKRCDQIGPDAKAEALLDWVYRLQQEEGDPDLKVLIFTEFIPTQEMLYHFLTDRGFPVVCLNGTMDMDERKRVQDTFARDARMLISTDAGGEGLNLQFCHVVINYDIPWNPMRLEQRIGRVDRIGQNRVVRAVNFVFEDSVEGRVREVLEEKLAIILEEFGIDKTGDVLDSAQAGQMFDDLYVEAILHPETVEASVENVVTRIKTMVKEAREGGSVLGGIEDLDPNEARRLMAHPLPYWVECMTVNYLRSHGGSAERQDGTWELNWPDGTRIHNAVFSSRDVEQMPAAQHLTLENPRIRGLAMQITRVVPDQPIPIIGLSGLPPDVRGIWSLWRISIYSSDWDQKRIMPLFLHDDGRVLHPTARRIWDGSLSDSIKINTYIEDEETRLIFDRVMEAAEEQGKPVYEELVEKHRLHLSAEREKGEHAFAARRRAIERIGLPEVRNYRLAQLARDEKAWHEHLERKEKVIPEMIPLILVRVQRGGSNG